jgi:hypothetical protein
VRECDAEVAFAARGVALTALDRKGGFAALGFIVRESVEDLEWRQSTVAGMAAG